MKKIASLMLASICLLAFAEPTQAATPRWGWSEVEHAVGTARLEDHRTDILGFARLAGPVTKEITVVSVNLDPKTTKVPGVLANVWPKLKDALNAVRNALSGDPTLKASLEGRGLQPDSVLGIGEGKDGHVAVFVSKSA
jgi:hypothetical protein